MSLIINAAAVDIIINVSTAQDTIDVDYNTTYTVLNPGPVLTQTGSTVSLTFSA